MQTQHVSLLQEKKNVRTRQRRTIYLFLRTINSLLFKTEEEMYIMAHFHTFLPSEPKFDYSNIDNDGFGRDFINEMKRIEDYSDREVNKEFNEKMHEQWEAKRFLVNRNNFWETYQQVRDFLDENDKTFTVKQKRALLMFLHQRDAILKKIKSGNWSYIEAKTQRYVDKNISDILSGHYISKRSVSEKKAKAKSTKARERKAVENEIIKSMKQRDLTSEQQQNIKVIEGLAAKIEVEAESGQTVPHLGTNWWKKADLDNFLKRKKKELKEMQTGNKRKKKELKEMQTGNENTRNGVAEEEAGNCTLM